MANVEAVELEGMRKEDSSWHPCQVSLCPRGVSLIVDYKDNYSQDIILNKEEALARLRLRSIPLQGDDCSHINKGEQVLATLKLQSKTLFFDAEVEKALWVRHSKRIHCRCTFEIKWLNQNLEGGTLVVPSRSIMKLATKSINVHPTISAFLNTAENSDCSTPSSLLTVVEDMDFEMDIHEMLERQIAQISNSADAFETGAPKDILFGVEADTEGQIECVAAVSKVSEQLSNIQVYPGKNHLNRSTWSGNKLHLEMEVKDPPPPVPSAQEEFPESKSPLNPLAARAALASLMSKVPQNLEFSTNHEKEEFSLKIQAAPVTFVPKCSDIVKSLFSTRCAPGKLHIMELSSGALIKERENENKTRQIANSAGFSCSTTESKRRHSAKTTRQSRLAVQKGTGNQNDDIERMASVEGRQSGFSTNSKRLTRSAVQREDGIQSFEVKKKTEENTPARNPEPDLSDQNMTHHGSYILKDKKICVPPLNDEIDLLPAEERKNSTEKEGRNKKHDIERKTSVKERENLNKRKLTHSPVHDHEERGNKSKKATRGILGTKKPPTTPLNTEINLPVKEEMHKKRKMSTTVNITQNTEGNDPSSGGSSQAPRRKSTSSKKQELRFSPRLRFLPRTRSQAKS
ncbi:unnamed protein product [Ilex paraguariensis]|uniref:SAWADEE domain-containing protein n=1 Tax=Ilex paraguariensis TaxID=185542 RepID=A0ABC8V5M5_9AQUA